MYIHCLLAFIIIQQTDPGICSITAGAINITGKVFGTNMSMRLCVYASSFAIFQN